MDKLNKIFRRSRFITIAPSEKGIVLEANLWPSEKDLGPYTINIRGYGITIESAAKSVLMKMKHLDIDGI